MTPSTRRALVVAVTGFFGAYCLALGAYQVLAPGSFYELVGPFGPRNDHYIRDSATFEFANGVVLLVALRRASWRVPVLAFTALRFGLHDLNHLWDIGEADPGWVGVFDFVALLVGLAWLVAALVLAIRDERAGRATERVAP